MSAKKGNRNGVTQEQKFTILHRDNFTCRYCGAKPGGENLEVDHLVPVALGGSDNEINLVASCKTCNRRRSDQALFPKDMILGTDNEGWHIIKQWGVWTIKACARGVVVAGAVHGSNNPLFSNYEYWFEVRRSHERDWEYHIGQKDWPSPHKYEDFLSCLEFARELTNPPLAKT